MKERTEIIKKLNNLDLKDKSIHFFIAKLIKNGFLDTPRTSKDIVKEINNICGKKLKTNIIHTYMVKFLSEDIIASFKLPNKSKYWYLTFLNQKEAKEKINLTKEEEKILEKFFSDDVLKKIEDDFEDELNDLRLVFGKSGTCTAFLLRKILEKLIFFSFAKNGLSSKLKNNGDLIGLKKMINTASSTEIDGKPFILSKTAKEIKGIKFLGDASAHNPLTNVDMNTIVPQMPFIITAYKELIEKL